VFDLDKPFCQVCGKQSYPSPEAAKAAGQAFGRSAHRHRPKPQKAYACPSGGGWHLAQPKKHRRT
jgi:hypothetical protein